VHTDYEWANLKEKEKEENLGVNGNMILKYVNLSRSGKGPMAGQLKDGNETSLPK